MKNFTRVPNALITDARLSLGARMVYIYIASKPGTWKFSLENVAREMVMSKDYVNRLLQELEALHLLKRERIRNANGRLGASSYTLTKYADTKLGETKLGNTKLGENLPLVRLNNNKTDINKTECERGDKSPAHTLDYFIQQTKAAQAALKAEGMKVDRVVVMKFHNYWTQIMDDGRMLWEKKPFDFTNRLRNWLMGEYATV